MRHTYIEIPAEMDDRHQHAARTLNKLFACRATEPWMSELKELARQFYLQFDRATHEACNDRGKELIDAHPWAKLGSSRQRFTRAYWDAVCAIMVMEDNYRGN